MAKGFETLHVKSAKRAINPMDISRDHLTTMDFGQIGVLCHEPTIPDDDFVVSSSYFCRMAPLVKPTYGKIRFRTVTVHVPYHMIAEDADAFFAGKSVWEGKTPMLRTITMLELWTFFLQNCSVAGTATDYDFSYIASSGSDVYRKFTNVGRYYYKLLCQLGYAIPENVDTRNGSDWLAARNAKLNAMPILAFAKAYNDWMSQSQRFNSSYLTEMLRKIKHDETISNSYSSGALTANGLYSILSSIFLSYESGYFTSAWQNPNAPLNAIESIGTTGLPIPGHNNTVWNDVNDQNIHLPTTSTGVEVGQRMLDFLQSFDNWVRRNNYSGSRDVQQIFSRFGIKTSDYRSNYADVINTTSDEVRVGDVTATASSQSELLGDYAGKGIMGAGNQIRFKASDYGMFFVFGYFTVIPMYPYGFDKENLKTQPLDFYNPEFDGIGAEPISFAELFENPRLSVSDNDQTIFNRVFGFTERYNSYRFGRDQITGDFRKFDNNADMNTWHMGRLLTSLRLNNQMVAQSGAMNTLPQSDSEYNRIFSITSGDVDHFYLSCMFSFKGTKRGMLNLNQVPRLGEGDTVVPRNGNTIS